MIFNIEEFVKILPKYFKTKNYSSFVRQLNLYNFHKIKNSDGHIEFAHEQFRRESIENLQFITRKVNIDSDSKNQKGKIQKPMSFEYNRLLGIIRNLENSLKVANQSTETSNNLNKNLLQKMEQIKLDSEKRTRKMFYVFWFSTSNFQPELLHKIKKQLAQFGIKIDDSLFETSDVSCLSNILEEKRIFSVDNSDALIDKLLILVSNYHNSRPENKFNKANIKTLLENSNSIGQHNKLSKTPPRLEKIGSCARSDRYSLESSPLHRMPSLLNLSMDEEGMFETKSIDYDFDFKDLSRVSKIKSGNTADDNEIVNLGEISFNHLRSPQSEKIYNY